MNSLFIKHKWMQVVWGVLLTVAGLVSIIFTATSKEENISLVLSVSIAVILFAYAIVIILTSFLEIDRSLFKSELITGALILALGIVFCIQLNLIEKILVSLAAASLISFGVVFIIRGVLCSIGKILKPWMITCYVVGGLFIGAGVLALIFQDSCLTVCYYAIGGLLIILGVAQIVIVIKSALPEQSKKVKVVVSKKPKKEKNEVEEIKVIDVQPEVKEEN